MYCYRHPKAETGVSCGKCGRPLCPRCMIAGPAGMRCADCASLRTNALYRIPPARLVLAIIAGLLTGIVGAFLMMLPFVGFFVFFVGPFYGGLVAEAVLRAAGRKRGRTVITIGVGSIVIGALLMLFPMFVGPSIFTPGALLHLLWPLVGFGLAVSTCYARLR